MKLRIILIGIVFAGFTSCEKDFLERAPLDSPSSATFFSNEEELDMALAGTYRGLYWHSYRVPYQLWLDAATDIAWSRGDFGDAMTLQGGRYTPSTTRFRTSWELMYRGVAKTNNILGNMDRAQGEVSPEKLLEVEAEAKFLRSYFYFYLINLYGDVPWIDHVLTIDEACLPRTPKDEILGYLYNDLDFAAQNLPEVRPGSEEGKATRGAAIALKARLALLAGDYDIAASSAKEIMDTGNYEIHPNYGELFKYEGAGSSEVIFAMQHHLDVFVTQIPRYIGPRSASGYAVLVPTQTMVDMYAAEDGLPIDESPLYDPFEPYENRDPRLDQSIVVPGEYVNNVLHLTHPDSTETWRRTESGLERIPNPAIATYATFTGYFWEKYLDQNDMSGSVTQSTLGIILFRYAEVLLTYAEAKIELGEIDQSVIDAINQVRGRESVQMPLVNSGMSQSELREIVRYERTIELALEGFRLFDIRRWGIAEHVMPGNVLGRRVEEHWFDPITPEINQYNHPVYPNETEIFQIISTNVFDPSKDYLWPIPQTELDLCPELEQNPGY